MELKLKGGGPHHALLDCGISYFSIVIYSEIFKIYSFQHLKKCLCKTAMKHLQVVYRNNSYAIDCASKSKRKIKAHFVP